MKKIVASIIVVAFLAGCTGPFNLTHKVYNFHRSQADKWSDELCFLLVALTPIYGLATFADAIVFNSIEFWTGKNPVTMSAADGPQSRIVQNGKEKMLMSYDPKTDQVQMTSLTDPKKHQTIVFERTDKMVVAKDQNGGVLYSSMKSENGDIAIYNGKGKLVKKYPAVQVASIKEKVLQN